MNESTIGSPHRASGPKQREKERRKTPLGIIARNASARSRSDFKKFASSRDDILIDRYDLQETSAMLLPKERVAKCHFSVICSAVKMLYIPSTDTAAYGNIETCGSVWNCPVCSAKIAQHRKTELDEALTAARAKGLKVVMCTYTFRHKQGDNLKANLDAMLAAYRAMKSGRFAKDLKQTYGVVGSVRALEVTHGESNGWHPHIHELVFLPSDADLNAFGVMVRARWEYTAASRGLTMDDHGFKIDSTDMRVAEYVAKFGKEPGEKTRQAWESGNWNEASELTQLHRKRGTDEHYTPFDLLRFAGEGDEKAAALWQEYARVFKGRRQLFWSHGLRAFLDLGEEETDGEIAEKHELDKQEFGMLSRSAWRVIVQRYARAHVLNKMRESQGDYRLMIDYLAGNFEIVLDELRPDGVMFRHIDECACSQ